MKKSTFQYDIWLRDAKDSAKDIHVTKDGPVTIEATSQAAARDKAVRAVPAEFEDRLDELDILVRAF